LIINKLLYNNDIIIASYVCNNNNSGISINKELYNKSIKKLIKENKIIVGVCVQIYKDFGTNWYIFTFSIIQI